MSATEMHPAQVLADEHTLLAAYAFCRAVAKREAKNFYYAFRALPRHKSDAMCVVYAFMRKADDLADDESMTLDQRRIAMAAWTEAWRASRGGSTDDPVFLALAATQQRFGIPDALLEQLVSGTTLDLQDKQPGVVHYVRQGVDANGKIERFEADIYETFEDLYRYCYLVASVVGLVCIRIFGYSDPRAELLAEKTGVAFQLTNILRDVLEDAERGRIYLPREDMATAGTNECEVEKAVHRHSITRGPLRLLRLEIDRAQEYYRAAGELIPLLDSDSRPAMRVLVNIYQGLLNKIARDPAAVFERRIAVSKARKLAILGRGVIGSAFARSGR